MMKQMSPRDRSAVVAALVKEYRDRRMFCGETLLQKSVFFLQEMLDVPLGFEFQLYIYGPFSFELQRHVSAMRGDDMLKVTPNGVVSNIEPAEQMAWLERHSAPAIASALPAIRFVADHLGAKGVKQLEKWATALYFTCSLPAASVDERAAKICAVKPHISVDEARKAVEEVDEWRRQVAA